MAQLIGNTVQTQHSNYSFATREEAEAFFVQVHQRDKRAAQVPDARPSLKLEQGALKRQDRLN